MRVYTAAAVLAVGLVLAVSPTSYSPGNQEPIQQKPPEVLIVFRPDTFGEKSCQLYLTTKVDGEEVTNFNFVVDFESVSNPEPAESKSSGPYSGVVLIDPETPVTITVTAIDKRDDQRPPGTRAIRVLCHSGLISVGPVDGGSI